MYTLHLRDLPPQSSAVFQMVSDQYPAPTDDPDELEATFWESLTNAASAASADSAYYGADIDASVFAQAPEYPWNLDRLDSLVNLLPVRIGGINAPMVYFGAWRSMFGLHVEDMNLSSINYLHAGAPKLWYGIAAAHASRVQRLCASWFPDQALRCAEFLRHKNNMVAPSRFLQHHVELHRCVQRAGEFVITRAARVPLRLQRGHQRRRGGQLAFEGWFPPARSPRCQCCGGAVGSRPSQARSASRRCARTAGCGQQGCAARPRSGGASRARGGRRGRAGARSSDARRAAAREAGKVPREATTRPETRRRKTLCAARRQRASPRDSAGASKTVRRRCAAAAADALSRARPSSKPVRRRDAAGSTAQALPWVMGGGERERPTA